MKPESEEWNKEFTKKGILDRLNLSVQEISELGIGWLILSFIILYLNGTLDTVIQEMTIPDVLLIYIFVLGISFFTHELCHKWTAIKYGAKAYFRISKEGLFFTLISVIVGIPILAVGAVFWWGEATASPSIRGRVSAAGPISNMILAGFSLLIIGIGFLTRPINGFLEIGLYLIFIGQTGLSLNVFLGIFNLLPFGVFDGSKVLAWDPKIWFSLIVCLLLIGLFGGGFIPFLGSL